MSLADELLADLEENDDGDVFMEEPEPDFVPASIPKPIEEGYSLYLLNFPDCIDCFSGKSR